VARKLVYDPVALADLKSLYDWVADGSEPATAQAYIARLEAACESLVDFPSRGTSRADLGPGVRTISFERKAVIAYLIEGNRVLIAGVFHHGRDLGRGFGKTEPRR
jgi:toxin ParE1/3/4